MWASLVALLVLGYLVLGRSFAYLGFPSLHLFVGDACLALFAISRPRALFGRWLGAMLNSTPLAPLAWSLALLVGYGGIELLRGLAAGYPVTRALETFVFCLYPLYVFVGASVGLRHRDLLIRLLKALAWAGGIYGIIYVAWLDRLELFHPAAPLVQVFGFGDANGVALVGLLTSPVTSSTAWIPLCLNSAGLLATLMRGAWAGVAAALLTVALLRRRVVRILAPAMAMLLLIGAAILIDFEIPAPAGRGGMISAREVAARVVAVIDPSGAAALGTETHGSASTIAWRYDLWRAIWNDLHQSAGKAVLGWGHGATLRDVAPFVGEDLRSPHNILLFALAYTGWLGLALFVMFQLALLGLAWRSYLLTGQIFGLACWVLFLVEAQFGNVLETPQGGIPFYLLMGLAVAPTLQRGADGDAHSAPA